MNRLTNCYVMLAAFLVATLSFACESRAHFLWLKTLPVPDGKPQAFLFFGESSADEAYHFPEKLASVKIWRRGVDGKRAELVAEALETDNRVGRVAPLASDEACVLEAAGQYGVYGTMLLDYCAKHVHAPSNEKLGSAGPSNELKLDVVPASKDGQLQLSVLFDGKPLARIELQAWLDEDEPAKLQTDDNGRVVLRPKSDGLIGVLVHHVDETVKGKLSDKEYSSRTTYSTLTFPWKSAKSAASEKTGGGSGWRVVPKLPEPLSSFGAVVVDGWLYIYGGHTGTEHHHSAANLSNHFRRIRLDGTGASGTQSWEELPMQAPLQGLPLVAHGGKIYRVGGLDARNPTTDENEDLHSVAEFAEFDPATRKWTTLEPLPAPRSSHNAAVVGDKLYVVGGWRLAGKSPGEWQPATLVYDFAKPQAGWQEMKPLPVERRALAAAGWNGKLVVLGGMDEKAKISMRVDLFDPAAGAWSRGPDLPGAGMAGFGLSAWNLNGNLYVSGYRGIVYRLSDSGSEWEEVARLAKPRFFHQLVPSADGGLLAIGGASQDGHLDDIEWINVVGQHSRMEARWLDAATAR